MDLNHQPPGPEPDFASCWNLLDSVASNRWWTIYLCLWNAIEICGSWVHPQLQNHIQRREFVELFDLVCKLCIG